MRNPGHALKLSSFGKMLTASVKRERLIIVRSFTVFWYRIHFLWGHIFCRRKYYFCTDKKATGKVNIHLNIWWIDGARRLDVEWIRIKIVFNGKGRWVLNTPCSPFLVSVRRLAVLPLSHHQKERLLEKPLRSQKVCLNFLQLFLNTLLRDMKCLVWWYLGGRQLQSFPRQRWGRGGSRQEQAWWEEDGPFFQITFLT